MRVRNGTRPAQAIVADGATKQTEELVHKADYKLIGVRAKNGHDKEIHRCALYACGIWKAMSKDISASSSLPACILGGSMCWRCSW